MPVSPAVPASDADTAVPPRFLTPRRVALFLVAVVCFAGLGWLGAPVLAGKPSDVTASATVARDVSPVMYLDESGGEESAKPDAPREAAPVCSVIWRTDDRGVEWVWVPLTRAAVYLPDDNGVWLNVDKLRTTWVWIVDSADRERFEGGEWVTYDGARPYCGTAMPVEAPR